MKEPVGRNLTNVEAASESMSEGSLMEFAVFVKPLYLDHELDTFIHEVQLIGFRLSAQQIVKVVDTPEHFKIVPAGRVSGFIDKSEVPPNITARQAAAYAAVLQAIRLDRECE